MMMHAYKLYLYDIAMAQVCESLFFCFGHAWFKQAYPNLSQVAGTKQKYKK